MRVLHRKAIKKTVIKWLKGCAFLMVALAAFLVIRSNLRATNPYLDVYLEGQKLDSGIQALQEAETTYVNLAFLRQVLHTNTTWRQSDQELYFKLGDAQYVFYADVPGYTRYYKSRQPKTLKAALREIDGQLWLPLEFITGLGLAVKQRTGEALRLTWKDNYLLDVAETVWHKRSAFEITATKNIKVKSYYQMTKPRRLVCELTGIKPYGTLRLKQPSIQEWVNQVRIKRQGKRGVQIVFDLADKAGTRIVREAQNPAKLMVVPDYRVLDVGLIPSGQTEVVAIKASAPADFKIKKYQKGQRLELLFSGAINQVAAKKIRSSQSWLRSVGVTRADGHSVKVNMELAGDAEIYAARSPVNPNWVEVGPMAQITAVRWNRTETGGDLVLVGDGVIPVAQEAVPDQRRFRIEFDNLRLAPGVSAVMDGKGPLEAVEVSTPETRKVKIEVGYKHWGGYRKEVAPDRRTLVYHFFNSPLAGKKIVLDPGHGGMDESACSNQNVREKDVNLETAFQLKNLLEQAGAAVVLTRTDDHFIGLYERAQIANDHRADLFVSIHVNYQFDPAIRGSEIYHFPDKETSQELAKLVSQNLSSATGLPMHGVIPNDFVVIRETEMPGVLVELGYLSNYREVAAIRTSEFKKNAARGIFQGIVDFYRGL